MSEQAFVLLVREIDFVLRRCALTFLRCVEYISWIRERMPGAVARRGLSVATGANGWCRATEELLAVALKAGGVLRIVGDIRERIISLAYLFPV